MTFFETRVESPIGSLRLIASETGLRSVVMPKERAGRIPIPETSKNRKSVVLEQAERELAEYFAGQRTEFTVPLEMEGTEFEKRVWRGLLTIPYGETSSYGVLAKKIGSPLGARAVGRANGLNPLSIVVPCHRVIGKSGALTGFAGGLEAKEFLLHLESKQLEAEGI